MTDTLLTAAKGRIREGDLVMVSFGLNEKTNNPAHRLDGQQFVVKRRRKPKVPKAGDTYLFELYGAASDKGMPYTFLSNELIKL